MACDVNVLLAEAACNTCLNEKQADIVELALLASIVLQLDPAADVTPGTLAAQGAAYSGLNPEELEMAELILLCRIANAT